MTATNQYLTTHKSIPPTITDLMRKINTALESILQDNYVGVYFHGSLRLGSFNPNKSDLDFIIITKTKLTTETKKAICDFMLKNKALFPKKGFEFSVVQKRYCTNFLYPTPYELHLSGDWEARYLADIKNVINDDEKFDKDLASHFNVINQPKDDMDFGEPSKDVFAIVPKEYVLDSNWEDVKNATTDIFDNPTYTILNLCRFCAFIKSGLTLSKYSGGEWALKNLPTWNSKIITAAINDYLYDKTPDYTPETLSAFAKTALEDLNLSFSRNL